MTIRTLFLALVAAGATCGSALAQPADKLNGVYLFASPITQVTGGRGQISGVMTVSPNGEGRYHVSLNTIETVDNGSSQTNSFSLQVCDGRNEGADVVMTCEVLNSTPGYRADRFRVRYLSGMQFRGELISTNSYPIDMMFHSRR